MKFVEIKVETGPLTDRKMVYEVDALRDTDWVTDNKWVIHVNAVNVSDMANVRVGIGKHPSAVLPLDTLSSPNDSFL